MIWYNENKEEDEFKQTFMDFSDDHLVPREGLNSKFTDTILLTPFHPEEVANLFDNIYGQELDHIPHYTGRVVSADQKICQRWLDSTKRDKTDDLVIRIQSYVDKMDNYKKVLDDE